MLEMLLFHCLDNIKFRKDKVLPQGQNKPMTQEQDRRDGTEVDLGVRFISSLMSTA